MKELNLFEINHVAGGEGFQDYMAYVNNAIDYLNPSHLSSSQQIGVGLVGLTGFAVAAGAKAILVGTCCGALTGLVGIAAVHYYNNVNNVTTTEN